MGGEGEVGGDEGFEVGFVGVFGGKADVAGVVALLELGDNGGPMGETSGSGTPDLFPAGDAIGLGGEGANVTVLQVDEAEAVPDNVEGEVGRFAGDGAMGEVEDGGNLGGIEGLDEMTNADHGGDALVGVILYAQGDVMLLEGGEEALEGFAGVGFGMLVGSARGDGDHDTDEANAGEGTGGDEAVVGVGGNGGDAKALVGEDADGFRELAGSVLGLDLEAGADGELDAGEAETGDETGEVGEGRLPGLGEEGEMDHFRCPLTRLRR